MFSNLAGFLAVSTLVIVTPGPDMALVSRNALLGGQRHGIATGVGVVSGLVTWTVAASLGLAALLRASEPAFLTLKLVGGAYLVYLGARSLWGTLRSDRRLALRTRSEGPGAPLVSLRQGLVSNIGNPKIAVFFTSFLPQFAPAHQDTFLSLLVLGVVFCSLTLAWLTGYGILVARASDILRRGRIRRALDGLTGAVLVGFGVRLALERR